MEGPKDLKAQDIAAKTDVKLRHLEWRDHPLNHVDRVALKAKLIGQGRESIEQSQPLIDTLIARLKTWYPPHLISVIANYGLMAPVGKDGVSTDEMPTDIHQYHVETLQALALTIPYEHWGQEAADPGEISAVIENLQRLTDASHQRRYIAMEQERDHAQQTVLMLQERLRGHTQFVRNWGYHAFVVKISQELYAPLDQDLRDFFGFGASDLIEVSRAVLRNFEARLSKRFVKLRQVVRCATKREMVCAFFRESEWVAGDAEAYFQALPKDLSLQNLASALMAHADRRLPAMAQVKVDDIVRASHRSQEVVEQVLQRLSFEPGTFDEREIPSIFLSNPIWLKPVIKLDNSFYLPMPQMIFSHIHSVMKSLCEEAGLLDKLKRRRASYLEEKVETTLRQIFHMGRFTANAQWIVGNDRFESDLLVLIDRTVLIVEAKSAALTPEGLRGAPDRVKRHVRELVVEPAQQSERLEQIILGAMAGDASHQTIVGNLGLSAESIDQVIRLSITLDDFSVLANAESELKRAGWVPEHLALAPTLNIADFVCALDILQEPVYVLHYLAQRSRLQKLAGFLGDEMDYLGFYLETAFNDAALQVEDAVFAVVGMSRAIDHYYTSVDAGVNLVKPRLKIHPGLERIVMEVQLRAVMGWTTISLGLLEIAVDAQDELFEELELLKERVSSTYEDPEHEFTLTVVPPLSSNCVMFYVFPRELRAQRKSVLGDLAAEVLTHTGKSRCIVIGRMIEEWHRPYILIAIAQMPSTSESVI